MRKLAILSSLLLLALNSCSNEEIFNEEIHPNYEKRITVVAEDLTPAEGTRTSYTENGNGYSFAWSEGDALGIFPENGYQTAFPIGTDGVGSNTAVFDGGDWALKPNAKYAACYPLVDKVSLDCTSIPIDYIGQVQDGNGSTAHLSKYDFMASAFEKVDDKGNVNFRLQHLGCLVQFKLIMPEADTFSALEIVSSGTPFITSGTYSLSDLDHNIANAKTSNKVTIGLRNVSTTDDNEVITITAMFAPVDLSNSSLIFTIKGSRKDYTLKSDGQNMRNGMAIDGSKDSTPYVPYVTFHAEEEQTLMMSKSVETIEYSINNSTWATLGTSTVTFGGSYGELRLRGKSSYGTTKYTYNCPQVSFGHSNVKVSCTGDIRTLVDYQNYKTVDTSNARFKNLFYNCTSLISAPELPAVNLADYCYSYMFYNCTSLTSAPELPAKTLASSCYNSMFYGCSSLTNAPELPAETLADFCYSDMFYGCSSLTNAPELPAETLADYCYSDMFKGCTSLTNVPEELPAVNLADGCYSYMFYNCTSLTSAPELPAKTLASSCYNSMFYGCSSLTNAPELPAKMLSLRCYYEMFQYCSSLTNAPELPAKTLADFCYYSMFNGCTSLTSAPKLPAETLADYCYSYMFSSCKSLTTAPELSAEKLATGCYTNMFYECKSLATAPELPAENLAESCYSGMFGRCASLTTAPELPAEGLATACYTGMFSSCTSLTTAPELPAENLATGCYQSMFNGCSLLKNAPELPAETLKSSCYQSMFNGCTSLIDAPELPAESLAVECYYSMFEGCISLTSAPVLPAKTLVSSCYKSMFNGCTSLNYLKMMATDVSASSCLYNWLSKVSATGTFVKNSAATWNKTGASGIPSGWTVKYDGENNINNGHEFVDLGLSVKWATCNVGAEKPEDYGNYYAWGETIGTESGKTIFTWDSYFDTSSVPGYNNRGEYIISFKKYQLNSKDLNTVIEPSDDAATVNWGTEWRIPTFSEMQELVNDCSWEWVTINGVNGYKVTSKGNGNFIFLPAAGWYGDSGLADDNASCSYWMSTMSPYYNYTGCMLSCNSSNGGNDNTCQGSIWRCRGLSVRAVCP